jgi:3-oxoacyl-ACP reductase-like protein
VSLLTVFAGQGFIMYTYHRVPENVNMDINGKTALVTGAAAGIGLEYVKELLRNGVQVSHTLQYTRLSRNRSWISVNS